MWRAGSGTRGAPLPSQPTYGSVHLRQAKYSCSGESTASTLPELMSEGGCHQEPCRTVHEDEPNWVEMTGWESWLERRR